MSLLLPLCVAGLILLVLIVLTEVRLIARKRAASEMLERGSRRGGYIFERERLP